MSMNGHCKRTLDTLHALGFRLDEDRSTREHRIYFHPSAPDRVVKVWNGISDVAARKVRILAADIAGLSSSGEKVPTSIAETARMKRRDARAAKEASRLATEKARAPFQRMADAAASQRRAAMAAACAFDREREIASLMMPGYGR